MGSEKTCDPTPGRLARAKREGDVPRSSALGAVVSCGAGALGYAAIAAPLCEAVQDALVRAVRGEIAASAYLLAAGYALVPSACACAGAIALTLLQGGGLRFIVPSWKPKRLHPGEGIKRIFSKASATTALKAAVVALVLAAAMQPALHDVFGRSLGGGDIFATAGVVRAAVVRLVAAGIGIGVLFGIVDVLLERKRWREKLKMSFDEVKRDYKQAEGDPLLRNRRRARHKHLIRGSMTKLKRAAFVVTNPTHAAVALEYRPPEISVPRVVVRAIDEGARAVKARARELRIPIVENVSLARALLAQTEVEQFIPRTAYVAVAQIVAELSREGSLRP